MGAKKKDPDEMDHSPTYQLVLQYYVILALLFPFFLLFRFVEKGVERVDDAVPIFAFPLMFPFLFPCAIFLLERRLVLLKIPRCDIDGVGEGK